MWHDQGNESILSFNIIIAYIKSYILIHTPFESDIWFKRYEQFSEYQNSVKHICFSLKINISDIRRIPLIISQMWCDNKS